jgi:hypothetical protein
MESNKNSLNSGFVMPQCIDQYKLPASDELHAKKTATSIEQELGWYDFDAICVSPKEQETLGSYTWFPAVKAEHSISFDTRKDFIEQLRRIPGRQCYHVVVADWLTTGLLKQLSSLDSNVVVHQYPTEELTHVRTMYIDNQHQQIILFFDARKLNKSYQADLFKQAPSNYKLATWVVGMYKSSIIQEDLKSCSVISLMLSQKLELWAQLKSNSFVLVDKIFLPSEIILAGETLKFPILENTAYEQLDERFKLYILPDLFYGIVQRRVLARIELALKLEHVAPYVSTKLNQRNKWNQWFSNFTDMPLSLNSNKTYSSKRERAIKELKGERFIHWYNQKTSFFRHNILINLSNAITARDEKAILYSLMRAFIDVHALPSLELFTVINLALNNKFKDLPSFKQWVINNILLKLNNFQAKLKSKIENKDKFALFRYMRNPFMAAIIDFACSNNKHQLFDQLKEIENFKYKMDVLVNLLLYGSLPILKTNLVDFSHALDVDILIEAYCFVIPCLDLTKDQAKLDYLREVIVDQLNQSPSFSIFKLKNYAQEYTDKATLEQLANFIPKS